VTERGRDGEKRDGETVKGIQVDMVERSSLKVSQVGKGGLPPLRVESQKPSGMPQIQYRK